MNRLLSILLIVFVCSTASAQTQEIPKGYAIVVGAYSKNKVNYALKYTNYVKDLGYDARFGLNERKSLIYVYVEHTDSFKEAIAAMKEMREKDGFSDTWVHVKTSQPRLELTAEQQKKAQETTKAMQDTVGSLSGLYEEKFEEEKKEAEDEESSVDEEPMEEEMEEPAEEELDIEEVIEAQEKVTVDEPMDDRLNVRFDVVNAANSLPVAGEIQIIDTERSKLIDVVETNEFYHIPDPKNGSGQVTIIADIFGFRKLQKEFNYYDPLNSATNAKLDSADNGLVVFMDLVRYHKGDIVTMYNVYFFRDASVLRPESKYEMNSLLAMLKENPNYRIKIHGHVNGKHSGPIIERVDNKFYELSDDNPKGYGSDVKLSRLRAETIRDYLIAEGITEDRMEIKAWGGKRMLHDKHSTKAKQNVRVEIEILSE